METQVAEYNVTDAAIAEMKSRYMGLTIKGLDDTEGFQAVHDARIIVKNHRIAVEKRRKELKADALAWGKKVDGKAKVIFGKLEPIETHLQTEEKKVTDEQKRIKEEEDRKEKEKIDSRLNSLAGYGKIMPFFDVAAMSDEEYGDAIAKACDEYNAELARIAEGKRKEDERKAKEEADRKAEAEKLAKEREDLDKRRVEQEAAQAKIDEANRKVKEAQEAAQKKINEDKLALEVEKAREQGRKDREEFERKAKEKADREAKEQIERDEQERIEREGAEKEEKARKAKMRPDKDKAYDFADAIADIPTPAVVSATARELLAWASSQVKSLSDVIKMKADDL